MKIIVMFFLLFACKDVLGQGFSVQSQDTGSVYYMSLKEYLISLEEFYKKGIVRDEYSINVQKNQIVTEDLPDKINNFNISYLTEDKIRRINKPALNLVVIHPVEIGVNFLKVRISDYTVSSKAKNKLNYALSGGAIYIYKFDCEKNVFVLASKSEKGI